MDTKKTIHRNANTNPCTMCMPLGGILAFKGIEKAMTILHGSQGCATYMRRHIAEHFNEPIDVASSSLNEKGTVYGGEDNLKSAIDNVIKVYDPKLIGVLTTCLAETIGEDIDRISQKHASLNGLKLPIVTVPTPGYGEKYSEGYFLTLKNIITQITVETVKHPKINIIVPNISPADVREIKRILGIMEIEYTLLPDISDTLDRPHAKSYIKLPDEGTKICDIQRMSGAIATIEMGITVADNISPGKFLADKYGVPMHRIPLPTGIENTDLFINLLQEITGNRIPNVLLQERGRLLDGMIDSHKYNSEGRAAVYGEPELVYALATLCLENGIELAIIGTGSKSKILQKLLEAKTQELLEKPLFLEEADFKQIRYQSKQKGVNIAIGHSGGKYLTEKEDIPLVRVGFPIHDRVGGQRIMSVGYTGTMRFLDLITNTILENKQKHYRKDVYKKFVPGGEKYAL